MQSHDSAVASSFPFPLPPASSPSRNDQPSASGHQRILISPAPSSPPSAHRLPSSPHSAARYTLQPPASSLRGKGSSQNFSSKLGSVPERYNNHTDHDEGILVLPHGVQKVKVSRPQFTGRNSVESEQAVSGIDWHQVHSSDLAQSYDPAARPASVAAVVDLPYHTHQGQQTTHPAHRIPRRDMSHHSRTSSASPSIFDGHHLGLNHDMDEERDDMANHYSTQPTTRVPSGEDTTSYDLKPPPPAQPLSNIELLHDRLFSADHLKIIIRDHTLYSRFSSFLAKYRPHASQALARYVETQKAVAAVDYANAIADNQLPGTIAALLEENFEENSRGAIDELVNDALPGYVTHRLVQVVTETLVKEITGQNSENIQSSSCYSPANTVNSADHERASEWSCRGVLLN